MLKTILKVNIVPTVAKISIIILFSFLVLLPCITFAEEPVKDLNKQGVTHFDFLEQQEYLDNLREKEQSDSIFLGDIVPVAVVGGLLAVGAIGLYFGVLKKRN